MLLFVEDEHKTHLQFLSTVELNVVQEFSRIAVEFLLKGINVKAYTSASQKLEVDVATVKHTVEGLIHFLLEASRLMLSDLDFKDSLKAIGFSDDLQELLLQTYLDNRADIRKVQLEKSMDLPHYHDLEWRFDVEVASRTCLKKVVPVILLKFHIRQGDKDEVKVIQTDIANLQHLTHTLEDALTELSSANSRRILRNI